MRSRSPWLSGPSKVPCSWMRRKRASTPGSPRTPRRSYSPGWVRGEQAGGEVLVAVNVSGRSVRVLGSSTCRLYSMCRNEASYLHTTPRPHPRPGAHLQRTRRRPPGPPASSPWRSWSRCTGCSPPGSPAAPTAGWGLRGGAARDGGKSWGWAGVRQLPCLFKYSCRLHRLLALTDALAAQLDRLVHQEPAAEAGCNGGTLLLHGASERAAQVPMPHQDAGAHHT